MKGCRPYSPGEFKKVVSSFQGRFAQRNAALFVLGTKTGFRISELRSLRIVDIWEDGGFNRHITIRKAAMKGKGQSRTVVLHPAAKAIISSWLMEMKRRGWFCPDSYLFRSQMGDNRPITSSQAAKILKKNFRFNSMPGKLSTHSMRKSFAKDLFVALDKDIYKLSRALGHKSITSTLHYLSFRQDEFDRAVLTL